MAKTTNLSRLSDTPASSKRRPQVLGYALDKRPPALPIEGLHYAESLARPKTKNPQVGGML